MSTQVPADAEPNRPIESRRDDAESVPSVESAVRRFGVGHVVPGSLGLVGPLVLGNDDDGLVNTDPGLFLGAVAVNGQHALLHVAAGVLGLLASRDREAARTYLGASAVFWSVFAVVGWRRFGFERGIHMIGGFAVDGWGNLGHSILSVLSLAALFEYGREAGERLAGETATQ